GGELVGLVLAQLSRPGDDHAVGGDDGGLLDPGDPVDHLVEQPPQIGADRQLVIHHCSFVPVCVVPPSPARRPASEPCWNADNEAPPSHGVDSVCSAPAVPRDSSSAAISSASRGFRCSPGERAGSGGLIGGVCTGGASGSGGSSPNAVSVLDSRPRSTLVVEPL